MLVLFDWWLQLYKVLSNTHIVLLSVQLKQMEQKLHECRTKAGIAADMKAQSSVEGLSIFHCINFLLIYNCNVGTVSEVVIVLSSQWITVQNIDAAAVLYVSSF